MLCTMTPVVHASFVRTYRKNCLAHCRLIDTSLLFTHVPRWSGAKEIQADATHWLIFEQFVDSHTLLPGLERAEASTSEI